MALFTEKYSFQFGMNGKSSRKQLFLLTEKRGWDFIYRMNTFITYRTKTILTTYTTTTTTTIHILQHIYTN